MGLFSHRIGKRSMKYKLIPSISGLNRRQKRYLRQGEGSSLLKKYRGEGFSRLERRKIGRTLKTSSKDPFSRRAAGRLTRGLKGW